MTFQEIEGPHPQGRLLNFDSADSPEVGFNEMMERGQERLKREVQELKMLRLQEEPLMPEKRSLDIHYFSFPLNSSIC